MTQSHTHTFNPWTTQSVRACASRIAELTKRDPSEVRKAVSEDAELKRFVDDHWVLGEKLMTPDFVRAPHAVEMVMKLIALRSSVESGALSDAEAQSRVSQVALGSILKAAKADQAAPAPALAESAPAPDTTID